MFLKKSEKKAWWLTDEDKEFISSYRRNSWFTAIIILLLGLAILLASNLTKQNIYKKSKSHTSVAFFYLPYARLRTWDDVRNCIKGL